MTIAPQAKCGKKTCWDHLLQLNQVHFMAYSLVLLALQPLLRVDNTPCIQGAMAFFTSFVML